MKNLLTKSSLPLSILLLSSCAPYHDIKPEYHKDEKTLILDRVTIPNVTRHQTRVTYSAPRDIIRKSSDIYKSTEGVCKKLLVETSEIDTGYYFKNLAYEDALNKHSGQCDGLNIDNVYLMECGIGLKERYQTQFGGNVPEENVSNYYIVLSDVISETRKKTYITISDKKCYSFFKSHYINKSSQHRVKQYNRATGFFESKSKTLTDKILSKKSDSEQLTEKEFIYLGGKFGLKKNLNKALEVLANGISEYPNSAALYRYRAFAYYQLKDYEKAFIDINKALKINPEYDRAHDTKGRIQYDTGDYKGALASFSKAISLASKFKARFYTNRGRIYRLQGEYENAIADFNQALSIKANYEYPLKELKKLHRDTDGIFLDQEES